MGKSTINYKWPFSITMLNSSTRGNVLGPHNLAIPWDTLSRSSIPSLPNLYPNWLPKMKRSNVKSGFHLVGTLWLCQNSYWKWPFIYSGFSHWTWWFSIVFVCLRLGGRDYQLAIPSLLQHRAISSAAANGLGEVLPFLRSASFGQLGSSPDMSLRFNIWKDTIFTGK